MTEAMRAVVSAALQAAPLGLMVLDRELRVIEANEVMARLAGSTGPVRGFRLDAAAPDLPGLILSAVRGVLDGAQARSLEYTGPLGRAGPAVTWALELWPVPGVGGLPAGVAMAAVDITERRRPEVAESAARLRVERMLGRLASLQTLSLALSGALTAVDVARLLGEHARRVLGAAEVEVYRRLPGAGELERLDQRERPAAELDEARQPLEAPLPGCEVARQGEAVWVESRAELAERWPAQAATRAAGRAGAYAAVPLTADGQVLGVLAVGYGDDRPIDLEDRAWLQAAAQQAAQALERAQVFEERERLLGLVGHDLRSPLTAITTSAELMLRGGQAGPRTLKVAGRILAAAQRMDRITRDLLDYTEVRLGRPLALGRAACDLGALIRRAVDEAAAVHPEREVAVTGQGDGTVRGDEGRLGQVVANLLENALRYGSADRPVRLAWDGRADPVVLTVANEGPPIPPETRSRIFEAFWRGAAAAGHRGLGLGLFIARQVVQAHGGQIEVRSGPLPETVFTVRLPRG